jgi:SAM-dependent methyltransferase
MPTPETYDFRQQEWNSPDVTAVAPNATAQPYYVLAYARTLPSGPDPELFVLSPSGNPLYIANEDDNMVTAVDVDPACGQALAEVKGVDFRQADLESESWPFAASSFDAVVVVHYLHRPLLPLLATALAEGGLLIYETFARGNERYVVRFIQKDGRWIIQGWERVKSARSSQ